MFSLFQRHTAVWLNSAGIENLYYYVYNLKQKTILKCWTIFTKSVFSVCWGMIYKIECFQITLQIENQRNKAQTSMQWMMTKIRLDIKGPIYNFKIIYSWLSLWLTTCIFSKNKSNQIYSACKMAFPLLKFFILNMENQGFIWFALLKKPYQYLKTYF